MHSLRFKAVLVRLSVAWLFTTLLLALALPSRGQNDKPVSSSAVTDNKAESIVQRGVESVGGNSYLNVRTMTGRGIFSPFHDGVSQLPTTFVDYIAYPDKERTEFTSSSGHIIQTNSSGKGWIFDGAAKKLKDQDAALLDDFKISMRTSVENLLHGWWKKEGAALSYVGRREAGVGRRNEAVRVTYPDAFWVEYEFGAKDGLPAKVIYQRSQKKTDTEETEAVTQEDRLQKPIVIAGVTTFFVIDHFANGVQTSRISYESVEYNRPLADSLFDKPASIKGLK